jgi:hypothetical protein
MTTPVNGKKIFGQGRAFAINNISNPTPIRFGLLQDQSLSVKRDVKEVFGEKAFAADVRGGTMSVTGKITYATLQQRLWNELMFETTPTGTSQSLEVDNESGTVPGTSTYTITVTNASGGITDLGVVASATGKRYARVAAASEVAGASYSLVDSTGVYTFAAGDANKVMKISYLYTGIGPATASGLVTINNQNQGENSNFKAVMCLLWNLEQDVIVLNNCVGQDATLDSKGSDFGKPTFSFMAGCDTSDVLGTFSYAEQ